MKRSASKVSVEEWSLKYSKYLTSEIFRIMDSQLKEKETGVAQGVLINFLASYIGTLVYRSLTDFPEGLQEDKEALYESTMESYGELKQDIQNAIAVGFHEAMSTYANKYVEYYCEVKIVPEPVNKHPC